MFIRLAAAAAVLFSSAVAQDVDALEQGEQQSDLSAAAALAASTLEEAAASTSLPYFNDDVSEPINVVCPFKGEVGYEPGEVTCGFIEVPENRSDPDSRTIRLLFAKMHAKAGLEPEEGDESADKGADEDEEPLTERPDPIAYLTGGPGAPVTYYVNRFLDHDLLKTRDIYILQQRGIEESGAFCPFYGTIRPELSTATNTLESELEQAGRLRACLEAAKARGVDISAYNTVENAHDVRALRRALGFETWNVWGISYGSHLGQMLTQVDPEGIRALVIDAIVPNDLNDLMRFSKWLAEDFEKLFARCDETNNPHCDGLQGRFEAALDLPWLRVEAADEEVSPSGEFYLPPTLPGFLAFSMMYEQDKHPAMPAVMDGLLDAVEAGDGSVFAGVGNVFAGGGDQGMSSAVRCNDGYNQAAADVLPLDLEEYPAVAKAVSSLEGTRALAQACIDAGAAPRDRADYQFIETDIPTLIVNGTWDPITPAPLAEYIAPGFSRGRLILVPYAGHGPTRSMSECSGEVLTNFYDDPDQDLNALDASCFEEGVGAPEFVAYKTTNLPLKASSLWAKDERKPLILAGVSAGLSAIILALSLVIIPLGFFARLGSLGKSSQLANGDGATRLLALVTAIAGTLGLGLFGVGGAGALEIAEESLIVGLASPAMYGSWSLTVAALLGAVLLVRTILVRIGQPVRMGTFLGFLMIGGSAIALFVTAMCWGLGPF
ncbi:MAG: alpha/beta fold hydrolase [Parvularculaceae bacterium]|nr:alpha/beta fold hydrolase [Parvularculaceae bacterium]